MVYAEDVKHAYLSEAAYATLPSDRFPQSKPWERVNASLSSPQMTAKIGTGWTVLQNSKGVHLSNNYAVVVVNKSEHKVAILCRGTSEFKNDVLINDIGGGFNLTKERGIGVLALGRRAQQVADAKGYKLTIAGHSLGGSLAAEVGSTLNVDAFTYNSPDLRHGTNELSAKDFQLYKSTKLHAFRLADDLVSLIGVESNVADTLPNSEHVNNLEAHRLQNVIAALEGAYQKVHGFATDGATREVILHGAEVSCGFEGGAAWSTTRNDVALTFNSSNAIQQIQYVTYRCEGNLLFTREVRSSVVLDSSGKEVSHYVEQKFHLSQHSEAALNAAQTSAINGALSNLFSQGVKFDVNKLVTDAGISAGKAFTTSTMTSYVEHALAQSVANGGLALAENVLSGAIQKGGVEAAYQILQGNRDAAIKTSIESLASAALSSGLGLPLSYSTNYQVSTGSLFGSRVLYSNERSYELSMGTSTVLDRFMGQVSLGLAFNRVTDVYTLGSGQVVQREAGGLAGVFKAGPVSGSVGLYNGVEAFQPITTTVKGTDGSDVSHTTWGSRSFEGQLMLRVHAGNRLFAANLLPAWRSTKLTYWEEHRVDGNPFEVRHKDVNAILSTQPTTSMDQSNLLTYQQYKDAAANSAYAVNALTQGVDQPSGSSVPTGGPANAGDAIAINGNTSTDVATTDGVHIQTSSVLSQLGHAQQINQMLANQGHTESVTNRYGTHKVDKSWHSTHTVDKTYAHTAIHEATAAADSTVHDGLIEVHAHRTDLDQSAEDLTHLHDWTTTGNVNHRGNKDWDYAPGQSRTMNNDRVTKESDFTAVKKEDGTDFSNSTDVSKNAAGEAVTSVRHVQELGKGSYGISNGHSGSTADELGVIDATTAHAATTRLDDTGANSTETQEFDTSVSAFGDLRSETTDGVTTNYAAGEKSLYNYELGNQHNKQEVTTHTDHSAYSKDLALGKREFNGVSVDNATMDIYAKKTLTTDTADHTFDANGKVVEGGDKLGHRVLETEHGNFSLQRGGTAVDSEGVYAQHDVKQSAVVNEFVQGTASCTVGESSTGVNPVDAKYDVSELKDLKLEATVIGKQYINSATTKGDDVFSSTTGPTTVGADGSKTTITDRFTRIDDVTTQTADISTEPSLSVNDLVDLSVEEGGVASTPGSEEKKSGKSIRGNIDRKHIVSGNHITHVEAKAVTRTTALGATLVQDFDDYVNPVKIESKIDSGAGDNVVLSDIKTTIDTSVVLHQHTRVEKSVSLCNINNETTVTTDTTDSTKPLEPAKHTSLKTSAVSAGTTRCAGAVAGGAMNLSLAYVHDGTTPSVHSVGNVLISGTEAFFIGNENAVMEVTRNMSSGLGIIGGIGAVAAVARVGLDLYQGGPVEKRIPAERVRTLESTVVELVEGSRVEVADENDAKKKPTGTVIAVVREEQYDLQQEDVGGMQYVKVAGAVLSVKLYYDVRYDLDGEMMAVTAAASIATSTMQAVAASSSIGVITMLGSTVGGGVIMAIPMVVDVAKVGYQMARGKVDSTTGSIVMASNAGGIVAGGLVSWGVSSALASALGTAAVVTSATGIGIVVAGAIAFSAAAFYAGRFLTHWLWKWAHSSRIEVLCRKYDIDRTSENQMDDVARILKDRYSTSVDGKKEFDEARKELEELYLKVEKVGACTFCKQEDGFEVMTWLGYMVTVLAHIKKQEGREAVLLAVDLLSENAYLKNVEDTKKHKREKENDIKRVAELRGKYDIDKDLKSHQQMEKIAKKLKVACHPDKKGGDTVQFQTLLNDLEELFLLEEKLGTLTYYEKQEDVHVMTWAGYTMSILVHLKSQAGEVAGQLSDTFLEMLSLDSYTLNVERAKKDLREKEKQKID